MVWEDCGQTREEGVGAGARVSAGGPGEAASPRPASLAHFHEEQTEHGARRGQDCEPGRDDVDAGKDRRTLSGGGGG